MSNKATHAWTEPSLHPSKSSDFLVISSWHGARTVPFSGGQGVRETNGEEVHSASAQQNNGAPVLCPGPSGLVTSSQTTNKGIGVGRATLILSVFTSVVAKPSSGTSPQ